MHTELENLPLTLVFKKSRQNLELLSQYYDSVLKTPSTKNMAIPIHTLMGEVPSGTYKVLVLGNAQTPRKVFNHANLKEILIRKDIHPLLAIEYIKDILKWKVLM